MADSPYVVQGKLARIDLEKFWSWPRIEESMSEDIEVQRHLAMFKHMKEQGFCLDPPLHPEDSISYLWFWDDGPIRVAHLQLQRKIGFFDVDRLPGDPAVEWLFANYAQVRAAVQADHYLTGATIRLYLGGAGGD